MNVVVSGATGGVGLSIVEKYASHGSNLILLGTSKEKLKKLSLLIKTKYSVEVKYFLCNIKYKETVHLAIKNITELSDSIDFLINNAGIFPYGPITESSEKTYQDCMDVNLKLPYLLSQSLFKKIQNDGGGKILNIGSSSSYLGSKNTVLYCASKHALLGFSRALNDEWKNYGVSVHCISPGTIDTKMASVLDQDKTTFINPKEFAELVFDISKYNGNMLVDEVRAVRKIIR